MKEKNLEIVDEYIFLGQLHSTKDTLLCETNRRIKMGWSAFDRLNYIFKESIPLCLKSKVFDQCVL